MIPTKWIEDVKTAATDMMTNSSVLMDLVEDLPLDARRKVFQTISDIVATSNPPQIMEAATNLRFILETLMAPYAMRSVDNDRK